MAEILLACGAILVALLDSSGELNWLGLALIISRTLSWSPPSIVFVSGRFGDTVLLGVGSCLISFVGGFTELFNLGVVV